MCGSNDMNISNLLELENNISEQYIRFIIRRNSNILCSIRSFTKHAENVSFHGSKTPKRGRDLISDLLIKNKNGL